MLYLPIARNNALIYIPAAIQALIMAEGPSNRTLIIKACREILSSRFGKPSDKIKAAHLLERMIQKRATKILAPGFKRKYRTKDESVLSDTPQPEQADRLTDLLSSPAA